MLEFENVGLRIGKTEVLKNLSFTVLPGEMVAFLGISGAGKSSLFHLLVGEKRATDGSIKLDDYLLDRLSANSVQKYRRQIGVVFQDFRLLPQKSVFDNVAFALEVCGEDEKISSRVPKLLEIVGLQHRSNAFPHELSGGEKQRTAIARALVHDPKILIADEATGNLDPKNSREIAHLFKKLNQEQGLTILFSTHDLVLVSGTNPRVIRLAHGEILFDKARCSVETAFDGIL
ncbi:ATP-binding cassette domain-containing protein [bacterium]|jgi:cell division transport system ATP-binding protein|nr:ATP-binding cassette domain-containing protein [bacterium]MBT6831768.1 ATP-binding cassette domain-containing protein [bacterium]MBT6996591.1 ATP-binding cassette domain-containing protein [bacterium]MBT7772917.1 ATP-binding cassette domain-containing protein [bacterium]